jgi:hypothetical protein
LEATAAGNIALSIVVMRAESSQGHNPVTAAHAVLKMAVSGSHAPGPADLRSVNHPGWVYSGLRVISGMEMVRAAEW